MTVETTDDLVVQRDTTLYSVQVENVMANVQDTDLLVVCRNEVPYKITGEDLKNSIIPPDTIDVPSILAPADGAGIGGAASSAPNAAELEFVGSIPSTTATVTQWGNTEWIVSTDSNFTSPMVGNKLITPGSTQTLEPSERGDIVLEFDTQYYVTLAYRANVPFVSSGNSPIITFKTAALPDGWVNSNPVEASEWSGITYGEGRFVAVANNGTYQIMYSDDAATWTPVTAPVSDQWTSIAYGDGVFVAIAYAGDHQTMYSVDNAVTWVPVVAPSDDRWQGIAFGNNTFVAVANQNAAAMYSTDQGQTWTASTTIPDGDWSRIAFGDNTFISVGVNCAMVSSDNGVTWTEVTVPAQQWAAVTYNNGTWVAIAYSGTQRGMYSTDNGVTWTLFTVPSEQWFAITAAGGRLVAVGGNSSSTFNAMAADGNPPSATWGTGVAPTPASWSDVCFGGQQFVAVAQNATVTMSSYTGESAVTGYYYDTNNQVRITADSIVNKYGIEPTADNIKALGIAELTEQPTYPVIAYQGCDDKFMPIEDLTPQIESLTRRNTVLRNYLIEDLLEATETIDSLEEND